MSRFSINLVSQRSIRLFVDISVKEGWMSIFPIFHGKIFLVQTIQMNKNPSSCWNPWGQLIRVSSTYQNQWLSLLAACLKALASKSSMKKVAITGERSNPMATPSVHSYLIDLPPPPFFTPTIHHSLPPSPPAIPLNVLSFDQWLPCYAHIGWFYEVIRSNHIHSPHYINTQPNNSGIILVFIKPENGIQRISQTTVSSYIYCGRCLRSHYTYMLTISIRIVFK